MMVRRTVPSGEERVRARPGGQSEPCESPAAARVVASSAEYIVHQPGYRYSVSHPES